MCVCMFYRWRMVLVKNSPPSRGESPQKENARKDKGKNRVSRGNSPADQTSSRGNSPGKSNSGVKVIGKNNLTKSHGSEWVYITTFKFDIYIVLLLIYKILLLINHFYHFFSEDHIIQKYLIFSNLLYVYCHTRV